MYVLFLLTHCDTSLLANFQMYLIIKTYIVFYTQVIRIHSPMRAARKQEWSGIPSKDVIKQAHTAALRNKRRNQGDQSVDLGQFGSCKVRGTVNEKSQTQVSGSPDMSETRKNSNYKKWEIMPFHDLRHEAQEHYKQMEGYSLYKMDGNRLDDLVCVKHTNFGK